MTDNNAPAAQEGQEAIKNLKDYEIAALNLLDIPFQLFRVVAGKMQTEGIAIDIPTEPGELIEGYLSGKFDEPFIKAAGDCSARSEQARAEVQRLKLEELSGSEDENIGYYITRNFCEGESLENLAMLGYRSIALKFIITQHIDSIMEANTEEIGIALLQNLISKITPDLISDPSLTAELADELTGDKYWYIESADILDAATEEGTLWAQAVAGAKNRREHPEEYPADALQMMIAGFADILDIAAANQEHKKAEPTDSIIEPQPEEKQKKNRTRRKKEPAPADHSEGVTAQPMIKTPNTPSISWLAKVINSVGASGIPTAIKTNRHEQIEVIVESETGFTEYKKSTDETEYTVGLLNPALFTETRSSTNNFEKIFNFVLQTWTSQGQGDTIGFPLQELIDLGIYSTMQSARKGIRDFTNRIINIIQGTRKLNGKDHGTEFYGNFIHTFTIKSGYVTMFVSPAFKADMFSKYNTFMPRWAYRLSNQSFSFLRQIMNIARQEAGGTGTFTLSINAIQTHLGLPMKDEVKGRKYKEKIQEPIERAIEEIEIAIADPSNAYTKGYNVSITPQYADGCSIDEFLDGKVKIDVEDQLFATLHEAKKKQDAYIEKAVKRKSRRLQKPKKHAK